MITSDDMQSWAYLLSPTFQFINSAGKPLTEGWIEVYIAGTRNKYYCASDFNGTLHPFQIPLDSLGANIVLANPDQAYDVYVYNKYGSLVMSRYHVSPGMAGGSGVLNITITSEDGTVSVNNDGNGNFDLSIQDTIDRIDVLEQTVSGLSSNSSVGYAIAHAYTVELDGSFDLINDAVTGIGYTPNMDGFRLKSGHVYQFNFNALFENGAFDRNCSGKLYLEGPNTIAQEWKFDLDDSYYHSQSINGSTVLVTPNDLNYYDVKLKLSWDVDYPNKPNVDLNKISIVDITTILSTTVSGTGGSYTGGDGIFVNDETNVISVDMDYINSHLDFDASAIIASAVNIATAYTDARVTSVSGDLVNLIASVTGNIPTGTVTQVQSDWTEQDTSAPSYIKHKPDLTVYATNASLTAVSSVLQSEVDAVSSAIPELPEEEAVEFEEIDLSDYALASAIPDVSDYVTHSEVSAVSGNIINTISTVSGDIIETVNNVSGDIIHTVESVSGDLVEIIETATANIPEQVNADWDAVSGKAEILNKPDLSVFATHNEVSGVSAVLNERINNVSADIPELPDEEEVEFEEIDLSDYALASSIPDVSNLVTHDEFVSAVTAVSSMIPTDYVTHNEVSVVSSNLVNYVNSVSGDITNYVDESIVSAINVATGACEQVQSDWTEDDTTDPSYIKNKPNEIEIIAGQNIGIFSDATTITIAASATDLSDYATHSEVNTVSGTIVALIPDISGLATHSEVNTVSGTIVALIPDTSNLATRTEVNNVSGILETEIQTVSAAIGEQVPNVSIQSPSGTLTITETVSGNNKIYSIDVATASGIEYGQFFATSVSGTAVMSKSKGNIDVTNDGKIKLKQGQSYHVTVRGRYNQIVLKDNYSTAAYIEYITNNFININVDESRSDNQYFELSYDLFKLNSDTNYLVFFNLDDAEVNDLYIEIHSLANVGGNGSSGGSSPEYDAGYGIQILNNVISVSGIAPQIQSDWNQTNTSSKDFIKNKPEEANLIAGAGVSITASGSNYIISAVVTGSPVITGYVTEAELQTVSGNIVNQIPDVSNLATKQEIATVSAQIPDISGLATKAEVSTASGTLNTKIDNVSASIPTLPSEEEVEFEELDLSDYALASAIPDVSNLATKSELQTVSASIPDVSNLATKTELATVSASIPDISGLATEAELQLVSAAIPDTSNLATKLEVNTATATLNNKIDTVSGNIPTLPDEEEVEFVELDLNDYALASAIPDVSNLASKSEVNAVSGTLQTEIVAISGTMVDVPSGVSGVVAGSGIAITASGSDYVISCTVTGGGSGEDNNVFIAEYGVTTGSEIQAALSDGKEIICKGTFKSTPDVGTVYLNAIKNYDEWHFPNEGIKFGGIVYDMSYNSATHSYGIYKWLEVTYYSSWTYTSYDYDPLQVQANWNESSSSSKAYIQNKPDLSTYALKTEIPDPVSGASGIAVNDSVISLDNPIGLVAGNNITITASGSSAIISGQAGGSTYTAGTGIDITNNEISVDNTVALKTDIPTDKIKIIPFASNLGLYRDTISSWINDRYFVYLNILSSNVPSSPDILQRLFAQGGGNLVLNNLTNSYVTFSGICRNSLTNKDYNVVFTYEFYNNRWTYTCSRVVTPTDIPDVSGLATKTELNTKQDTLTGITDVQVVQALPVSPVSSVLYLIPEA